MRNWSIFTVRFGGREIRIHLTFVVLLLFLLLVEVNRSGPRVITRVFIITGLILLSALLHELGHVWVSARQGFPIKAFVLLPIGGLTMGDPALQEESARNLRKEILIAVAGPLVNAILAGLTAAVLFAMGTAHTLRLTPPRADAHPPPALFTRRALFLVPSQGGGLGVSPKIPLPRAGCGWPKPEKVA